MSNLPFYIEQIFSSFSQISDVKNLLRIFQILRILRLARHSVGLQAFGKTLKRSKKELILLVTVMMISCLIFSSMVYFVEKDRPETSFDSIPKAFYFAIVTATSVYIYLYFIFEF